MTAPGIDGTSETHFYSFTTGATASLVRIGLPEYGPRVSPDEGILIYDQLDDPGSHLMVENFH